MKNSFPRTVSELKSFLGAIGYYRKFINNFAQEAAPLTKLLKKNRKYEWNEEQQMEKGTIILNLVDGPYIANLVPHEEDMNYVVLYVAYNNKLYEITYNNYSYEEVLELIKDIYFE